LCDEIIDVYFRHGKIGSSEKKERMVARLPSFFLWIFSDVAQVFNLSSYERIFLGSGDRLETCPTGGHPKNSNNAPCQNPLLPFSLILAGKNGEYFGKLYG
jgi:hypothetical protein